MKKKGFTLIEILAVIVILAIIALITVPLVYRITKKAKEDLSIQNVEGYIKAAERSLMNYAFENEEDISGTYDIISTGIKKRGTDLEIVVSVKGNKPTTGTLTFDENGNVIDVNIPISSKKSIVMDDQGKLKKVSANDPDNPTPVEPDPDYTDTIEANAPELLNNMIPVKYDGTNWVYADTSQAWYNYDNKEWANAVVLNTGVTKSVGDPISEDVIALWYVWIPRYKYKLFNANNGYVPERVIDVTFESGTATTGTVSCVIASNGVETCTNATNGNWYTHPAFTLGTQELTGIWVGKFEISTTDSSCNEDLSFTNCNKELPLAIKPNVKNWEYTSFANLYYSIKDIASTYSISNGDSHMVKNMEWGATAYFKQSRYGLGTTKISKNATSITGAGNYKTNVGQSTTGNITGIYDMNGGVEEYVMGTMLDSSGNPAENFTIFKNNDIPETKYYDLYSYGTDGETYERGHLGDATREILKSTSLGWDNSTIRIIASLKSWIYRGTSSRISADYENLYRAGAQWVTPTSDGYTSRAVLTKK